MVNIMSRELKAHRIQRELDELYVELKNHQDKCKHKRATCTHGANTGNYDPHSDKYWTTWDCPTCLKRWLVDGSSNTFMG